MLEEREPPRGPDPRQGQDVRGAQHRVDIRSGGSTTISGGAVVAGGDVTIIQKARQWAFANPLLAASLAVVVLSGSIWTGVSLGSDPAVDVSVVEEPGLPGALHTVEQTRLAERLGDAASWCHLVQPGDSSCETTMNSAFAAKSQSYRDRVEEVGLGEPEKIDSGAQVALSWQGSSQGTARLVQAGGRWQLNTSDYGLLKLCGAGLFLSLVDAKSQELKCGMFQLPTS
ncbi:hypothetical protein [Streptomyces chartreusis]|uniref:Uncharacterized protein n=1 Tax=Streptomyces chartreusis TaxID=1969 RepID=A0A7H8TA93_STRCX|nr:hypothetical protein [Streptomyces chartreusis]QKZ19892.1 hypothetical protein HUT05_22525 [Streptomyces chartreusis]